jgi:hypothetical protein
MSACATNEALDHQLSTSREAVDQAQIAGAQQGAPADYDAAVHKLEQANVAAKNRDHEVAMRMAQEAQADANLAHARTDSAQARIAAAELTKSNLALRAAYNRGNPNE